MKQMSERRGGGESPFESTPPINPLRFSCKVHLLKVPPSFNTATQGTHSMWEMFKIQTMARWGELNGNQSGTLGRVNGKAMGRAGSCRGPKLGSQNPCQEAYTWISLQFQGIQCLILISPGNHTHAHIYVATHTNKMK